MHAYARFKPLETLASARGLYAKGFVLWHKLAHTALSILYQIEKPSSGRETPGERTDQGSAFER